MTSRARVLIALAAFLGVAAAAAFIAYLGGWFAAQPIMADVTWTARPYLHGGDHVRKTRFHAGDQLFIHIEIRRSMSCYSEVNTRIVGLHAANPAEPAMQGATVWFDYPDTHVYMLAGAYERDYLFRLPSDLQPGTYFFERVVASMCDEAHRPIYQVLPLVSFEIVD